MCNGLFLVVFLGLCQQPVVTPVAAPPVPVAAAPERTADAGTGTVATPLSAEERAMVGRWGVDIDGILKIAKEQPEELGLAAGASPEEVAKAMMSTVPFFKSMSLDLRDDRTAVFVGAGAMFEGTWKIADDHVALDGPEELKGLALRRELGKVAFTGPAMSSKALPAKQLGRGEAITAALVRGEWTIDVDASVKATRAYWQEVFAIMPAALKEKQEQFFAGLPQKLKEANMSLHFEGDKATFATQGLKAKEASVRMMGDMVLLKAAGGLKEAAADAPEATIPLFVDGKMLAMNMSSFVGVFVKRVEVPAKPVGAEGLK